MDWHDIALPVGSPESGTFGLQLTYTLPDSGNNQLATDRQAEAVKLFYKFDFGVLFEDQAHALLSCREYARLSSQAIFKRGATNSRKSNCSIFTVRQSGSSFCDYVE